MPELIAGGERPELADRRKNVSDRQVRRLFEIASNFSTAIKPLSQKKRKAYLDEQHEVAEARRRAQTNDKLLRLRLK